jgi:hypothetical protein
MRISLLVISLSFALPYVGRADEPTVPSTAAAAPASDGSITATPAAPLANATNEKTPAQLKKDAAEAKIKQFGVNGYKPESTKSGDTVYCKKETPVGSRFETKQCRTFEQLRDETINGREFVEQLQRSFGPSKN